MIGRVGFSISITNPWARGIIFTFFGLVSLVAEIILIYHEISVDDFLWVNYTNADGITSREYKPAMSIFFSCLLAFGHNFALCGGNLLFQRGAHAESQDSPPAKATEESQFRRLFPWFWFSIEMAATPRRNMCLSSFSVSCLPRRSLFWAQSG